MKKVKIYMRNGNVVEFFTDEKLQIKTINGNIVQNLEWKRVENKINLFHIDTEQIEAITYEDVEEILSAEKLTTEFNNYCNLVGDCGNCKYPGTDEIECNFDWILEHFDLTRK